MRVGQTGGVIIDKKYFICLFHVSEHLDHFKAHFFSFLFLLENDPSADPPTHPNWKIPVRFYFLFLTPSLLNICFQVITKLALDDRIYFVTCCIQDCVGPLIFILSKQIF